MTRSNESVRVDAGRVDAVRSDSVPLETTSTLGLVMGLVIGLPIIAYGIRGVLVDSVRTHPFELARWVVGIALVHDLVLVPIVLVLGAVVRKMVRDDRARRAIRAGFIMSASLTLVAWPLIRGYGRRASVPSLLPRNYLMGFVVYLVITWVFVVCMIALTRMRRVLGRSDLSETHGGP